jgi:hypothetical protein
MLAGACLCVPSCGTKPPQIEEVYDRLVECIEDAHEVNVLLFGEGLPIYDREGDEEKLIHRYYGVANNGLDFVSVYTKYATIEDIKAKVERVYSKDYRESLYETLFTGFASDMVVGSVLPARYSQDDKWMYQNSRVEPLVKGVRVYDYSAMRIVSPSNASRIKVELPSYSEKNPENWITVDLTFVYEEGNWYLDGPSC